MKKKYLFLLLFLIFLSSSVAFKAGYHDSEKIMINVFESSKTFFSHRLATQNKIKFAYLTDSHIKKLDGNRYQVDSYVDLKNYDRQDKRVRYTMIVHWNGQEYAMEDLRTEGL